MHNIGQRITRDSRADYATFTRAFAQKTIVCFVTWRRQRTVTTYDDDVKRWWRATTHDEARRRRREGWQRRAKTTYDDVMWWRRWRTTTTRDEEKARRQWRCDGRREAWRQRTVPTYVYNEVTRRRTRTNDNKKWLLSTAKSYYYTANKIVFAILRLQF